MSGSAIHTDEQIQVEASIFELYIDLMCKFRPNDVYNFLKPSEGYRLEQTLAVSRLYIIILRFKLLTARLALVVSVALLSIIKSNVHSFWTASMTALN